MMKDTNIPHLDHDTLNGLRITAMSSIKMLEDLIKGKEKGSVHSSPKMVLQPSDGRYIMATLAAMDDPCFVVTKSLVLNDRNRDKGLSPINSIVSILDGETGLPLATLDGNWITAVRTAALSALAANYLANKDAKTIGFVGAGVQARSHLDAFAQMFPLEGIKIFGRGQVNINRIIEQATGLGLSVTVAETAEEALRDVDLVVTSVTHTGVNEPFLTTNFLAKGVFATLVDLSVPWHKSSFSDLNKLFIDDVHQEDQMPIKLADPSDVTGDLSDLVLNRIKGRTSKSERIAFAFRGVAIGDLALAALAYQEYLRSN